MKAVTDWLCECKLALLRGRAEHLRALAADYEAQASHCRSDATMFEARITQMECRRLLTRQALREL